MSLDRGVNRVGTNLGNQYRAFAVGCKSTWIKTSEPSIRSTHESTAFSKDAVKSGRAQRRSK